MERFDVSLGYGPRVVVVGPDGRTLNNDALDDMMNEDSEDFFPFENTNKESSSCRIA